MTNSHFKPLNSNGHNNYTNAITHDTQPMLASDYRSKDNLQMHNSPATSPAARYSSRPGQDSAPQAEHSGARKQPSIRCETSSHKLTATAHINSNSIRNLLEEDLTAESSSGPRKLTFCPQDTDKRPKAKASAHTGNLLTHNNVPNVCTTIYIQPHTTSMHTDAHKPPVTPASSTPSSLPIMPSEHLYLTPHYDLHLTLNGTALYHLHSLEVHLLHTIQCTLSPLVVYSILGPSDDPLSQLVPPTFHTPAIQEYVRILCRPLVLFLDQAASSSLMDMEDITQQLLDQLQLQHQPPSLSHIAIAYYKAYQSNLLRYQEVLGPTISAFVDTYITNLNGRHHAQWFSLSPIGCLRYCPTIQQYSATHCPRTEDAVAVMSPGFFQLSVALTNILHHHSNHLFHAISTQISTYLQHWKRDQTHQSTPTPNPMPLLAPIPN
jgi:hypothetical protein